MSTPSTATTVSFLSQGTRCEAWHVPAENDDLAGPEGRPVVVMAHGFGCTRDSGLAGFAEVLAAAGLDVLAFDYRGFGTSEGQPRQLLSLAGQVQDYEAAIVAAAGRPGVDPARVVLWGTSLSGSHVLRVAAGRSDVAAVVAMTPLVSGWAAAQHTPRFLGERGAAERIRELRPVLRAARALVAARAGGSAPTMPIVGRPGETAVLTIPGALEEFESIVGPSWRNEVVASVAVEVLGLRTTPACRGLDVPVLVQIADHDRCAPPDAAARTAFAARAVVRRYACDHFDVYPGRAWHRTAAKHQVRFLTRVLTPTRTAGVSSSPVPSTTKGS